MSQNTTTFLSALQSAQAIICEGSFYTNNITGNTGASSRDEIMLDLQGYITLELKDHAHGIGRQFTAGDIRLAIFSTVLDCWYAVDTFGNAVSLRLISFNYIGTETVNK